MADENEVQGLESETHDLMPLVVRTDFEDDTAHAGIDDGDVERV